MDNGESTMESAQKMPQSEMKRLLVEKNLSLLILMRLPENMQVMFSRLIGHPRLIIESLLMSEQISVLSSLFNEIEETS